MPDRGLLDAAYRRALEAGATSVQEPVKKDDADKRGGVKDAGGPSGRGPPRRGVRAVGRR